MTCCTCLCPLRWKLAIGAASSRAERDVTCTVMRDQLTPLGDQSLPFWAFKVMSGDTPAEAGYYQQFTAHGALSGAI